MKATPLRRVTTALLLCTSALLCSCENNSGVGFSVGLPTNYGSMELGLQTTQWVGGPFW